MKYGTIDVALDVLMRPRLADQAEALQATEVRENGRVLRLLVKATDDVMPDGGNTPLDCPHLRMTVTQQRVDIQFAKET